MSAEPAGRRRSSGSRRSPTGPTPEPRGAEVDSRVREGHGRLPELRDGLVGFDSTQAASV